MDIWVTLGKICRYYFVAVLYILFFTLARKRMFCCTQKYTQEKCRYHCDAFKKFQQIRQLFCKPWTSFSISTEHNASLTEDRAEDILQALSAKRHRAILSVQRCYVLCKMGCLTRKFGEVCMCPNPHTLAKALGIYYITAGVLTVL